MSLFNISVPLKYINHTVSINYFRVSKFIVTYNFVLTKEVIRGCSLTASENVFISLKTFWFDQCPKDGAIATLS